MDQSSTTNDNIIPTRKRIRIQDWSGEQSEKILLLQKTSSEKSTQTNEIKVDQDPNIEAVKSQVYKSLLSKLENDLECGICKEIYLDCCILPCGHIFCSFCIRMWFLNADSCPICRLATEFIIGTKIIDNFLSKLLSEIDKKMLSIRQQMIQDRKVVLQQAESNWVAQNNNNYYPTHEMWQEWLSTQSNDNDVDRPVHEEEDINNRLIRTTSTLFSGPSQIYQGASRNLWPWTSEETLSGGNVYQDTDNVTSANLENDNLTFDLDYEDEEVDIGN